MATDDQIQAVIKSLSLAPNAQDQIGLMRAWMGGNRQKDVPVTDPRSDLPNAADIKPRRVRWL
jgi:hypothetical protein